MIVADVPLARVPDDLFAGVPIQSSAGWWDCVITTGLPPGGRVHLLLASDAGRALGLLPLFEAAGGVTGLVTPYTCLFQPVVAPATDLAALGRAFGRACAAWSVLRLDALDAEWTGWSALLSGFAAAGFRAAWFDSFGNWHADISDGWDAYLGTRPGALRETIRRKLRRAERDPLQNFTLARGPADLASALAAYADVYARSWKSPEPYPAFGPAFLARAAGLGVLRMGVLRHGETPLAAQYWIVENGVATVLKLAHDKAAKAVSPGTVLTAWMIRAMLADGVTSLDFGRGDDPYKRLWTTSRRQRKGLILARPWRVRGAAALARQMVADARRRRSAPIDPK